MVTQPNGIPSHRRKWIGRILFLVTVLILAALCLPLINSAGPEVRRVQCKYNNVKQIGLALLNYRDKYGTFPPACIADDTGRPMHSWRVLILPFLDLDDVYEKYRFDEPWVGPNNSLMRDDVGSKNAYHCHEDQSKLSNTSYLAVVGANTAWPGTGPARLDVNASDFSSGTLLVVEVVNSEIHWMEPRDIEFDTMSFGVGPGHSIGSNHFISEGWPWSKRVPCANAACIDGRTFDLTARTSPDVLRALLTVHAIEADSTP